ncbi:ribonuclease P protein component [Nitrospira moscoviensis]|uniref:Ribonuclease P protein component n=1 Tax=Nitrospira moscoviensis TaxID=42253 RepID=A0A0K2G7Y2_NITMO|nr:ribonuclease P protein component [Nitrospira moscoviensis]ALA56722.1 Ribonuclease P protein component [Nitrospira moscoviensis]
MMPKQRGPGIFLRASRDIELVKRHGRRWSTSFFNLLVYKMEGAPSRAGIVVGKRFGNAVRRNRAKRVFRELIRQSQPDLLPGQALLVFPKREALLQPFGEMKQVWEATLQRMRVVRSRPV